MSASLSQTDKDAPSEQKKLIPRRVQHIPPTVAQQKHEPDQTQRSIKETVISWLPTDSKTFVFELVIMTYLISGVIHFSHTGDTSMLTTLLMYVAAYVGVTEVKPLFSLGKRENNNSDNKKPNSS
jgi:hypothetical protein